MGALHKVVRGKVGGPRPSLDLCSSRLTQAYGSGEVAMNAQLCKACMCLEGMLMACYISDGLPDFRSDLRGTLRSREPRRPVGRVAKVALGHKA